MGWGHGSLDLWGRSLRVTMVRLYRGVVAFAETWWVSTKYFGDGEEMLYGIHFHQGIFRMYRGEERRVDTRVCGYHENTI
jgi:hypothetical protein